MDNSTITKLNEYVETTNLNPEMVAFYQRLLRIQSEAEHQASGIPIQLHNLATINRHLADGVPLLIFDDISLDWKLVKRVFVNVLCVFADYPRLFGRFSRDFPEADASLEKAARAWFTGNSLQETALSTGLPERLLQDVMKATLRPFLIVYAETLRSELNQERWRRAYCPVCGGIPDFAFLAKEDGARWLVCSRCDTEWLFQRFQCPYCGIQDQDSLTYFTDDEGLYRLYVCDQCKQYLKAIDLRQARNGFDVILERLFTLNIDIQARESGYG
jgi:FdhE protein